ncbi:MAG: MFS transporter [Steroidobacteraceae bacterium]
MRRESPHPAVYLVLIVPFGALGGYLTVALAYTLSEAGMSSLRVGALIGLFLVPQTWKFLWAPIVDTTLTRKGWYAIGASLSALGVLAMGAQSSDAGHFFLFEAVVLLSSLASTFLGMSVESLTTYTSGARKGQAGGWLQAGNLGGNGLGGGAALWLSQHVAAPWVTGAALGATFLLCCIALLFIAEPVGSAEPPGMHRREGIARKLLEVVRDLWGVLRTRGGYLALLLVFLPLSTSAATNLFSAVAGDWRASAQVVALTNGALGGVVAAVGCLAGGYWCDRFDRKSVYIAYGVLQALCAIAMALGPRTEVAYAVFTMLYWFVSGLTYAAFSAVTLEAIGLGAAATKYNVFASLSNMPLAYMTVVEGWAHGRWGAGGILYVEAAVAVASMFAFGGAAALSAKRAVPALT